LGLHPQAEHGLEDRRFERGAVEQSGIDAAERLEIGRLLAHAFPFFVMPVVALLAVLGPDEHLFDLRHPIVAPGGAVRFLRHRPVVPKYDRERRYRDQPDQNQRRPPHQSLAHPTKWKLTSPPTPCSLASAGSYVPTVKLHSVIARLSARPKSIMFRISTLSISLMTARTLMPA